MFSEELARAIVAERTHKATLRVDDTLLTVRPIEITDVDRLARMTGLIAGQDLTHVPGLFRELVQLLTGQAAEHESG